MYVSDPHCTYGNVMVYASSNYVYIDIFHVRNSQLGGLAPLAKNALHSPTYMYM